MARPIRVSAEFERHTCIREMRAALYRNIPPTPGDRPQDVVDVTEAVLKNALPGFHVRVEVTRIATGNGTGN